MKKFGLIAVATLLLAGGLANPVQAKVTEQDLQQAQLKLLGFLASELQDGASISDVFNAADGNGDKQITLAEFKKFLKQFDLGIKASVLKQLFILLEANGGNGDKKLTMAEFLQALASLGPDNPAG